MAMPATVQYQFISGNGDAEHAERLTAAGKDGWRVMEMEFTPDEEAKMRLWF